MSSWQALNIVQDASLSSNSTSGMPGRFGPRITSCSLNWGINSASELEELSSLPGGGTSRSEKYKLLNESASQIHTYKHCYMVKFYMYKILHVLFNLDMPMSLKETSWHI